MENETSKKILMAIAAVVIFVAVAALIIAVKKQSQGDDADSPAVEMDKPQSVVEKETIESLSVPVDNEVEERTPEEEAEILESLSVPIEQPAQQGEQAPADQQEDEEAIIDALSTPVK